MNEYTKGCFTSLAMNWLGYTVTATSEAMKLRHTLVECLPTLFHNESYMGICWE